MVKKAPKKSMGHPPRFGDITNVLFKRQACRIAQQQADFLQTCLHVEEPLQSQKDQQNYLGKRWVLCPSAEQVPWHT